MTSRPSLRLFRAPTPATPRDDIIIPELYYLSRPIFHVRLSIIRFCTIDI